MLGLRWQMQPVMSSPAIITVETQTVVVNRQLEDQEDSKHTVEPAKYRPSWQQESTNTVFCVKYSANWQQGRIFTALPVKYNAISQQDRMNI